MQPCQQILAGGRKLLNFFLPVYKPAGLCCLKLSEAIKMDLYFVMEHHKMRHEQILMNKSRYLEPFACGVITYISGPYNVSKIKNFRLASHSYDLTVEFGVERELHCIDGPVTNRTSTKDLNEIRIRSELASFQGKIKQDRTRGYRLDSKLGYNRDLLQVLNELNLDTSDLTSIDMLNGIDWNPKTKDSNTARQKYPYIAPKREVMVESIELVEFRNPYADFRIKSDGSFNVRRFVRDLASQLGTHASAVSMCRTREGPISKDDFVILQPHELQLEQYANRIPIYNKIYDKFNREMDPLWENVPT